MAYFNIENILFVINIFILSLFQAKSHFLVALQVSIFIFYSAPNFTSQLLRYIDITHYIYSQCNQGLQGKQLYLILNARCNLE